MFSFPLFRITVTVRGSFLLMAALLGLVGRQEPLFVLTWVLVVFVSILIHELGHALTARRMGATVEIELNGLGGLTRWSVDADGFGPGKRALVAAAGSAVGVVFGGLVWLLAAQFGPYSGLAYFVINNLIFVNVFWGLLNWVPIRPLDGGHLLLSLLQKMTPTRAESIARGVFTLTSAVALIWALQQRLVFIAILAGWMLLAEMSSGRARRPLPPTPVLSYDEPNDTIDEGHPDVEGDDANR